MYFLMNEKFDAFCRMYLYEKVYEATSMFDNKVMVILDTDDWKLFKSDRSFLRDHLNKFYIQESGFGTLTQYMKTHKSLSGGGLSLETCEKGYKITVGGRETPVKFDGVWGILYVGDDLSCYCKSDIFDTIRLHKIYGFGTHFLFNFRMFSKEVNILFRKRDGSPRCIWGSGVKSPVAVDDAELAKVTMLMGLNENVLFSE